MAVHLGLMAPRAASFSTSAGTASSASQQHSTASATPGTPAATACAYEHSQGREEGWEGQVCFWEGGGRSCQAA